MGHVVGPRQTADQCLVRRSLCPVVGSAEFRPADRVEDQIGAADMDRHALEAPLAENLPAWHALVAVWNRVGLALAQCTAC